MFNTIRGDLSGYRDIGAAATPGYAKLLGIDSGGAYTSTGLSGGAAAPTQEPDWDEYLSRYTDVQKAWENLSPENKAYYPTPQSFAKYHYEAVGRNPDENRTVVMKPTVDPIQAQLEKLPGYQFQRDQGVASVGRALGTKGLTGAQAKGIARFVTGLADSTYGAQVDRLKGAVEIGQNAANQTGAFGQSAATNSSNALIGGANASAAGQVGSANAIGSALGSIPSALLTNKLLSGGVYNPAPGASIPTTGNGVWNYGS